MREKPLFYKIYFGVLIGFGIVFLSAVIYFYGWLKDYEKTRPEVTAQSILTDYIKSGNAGALKEECGLKVSEYESEKSINKAVSEHIAGKKLSVSTSAKKEKGFDYAYNINADEKPFLSLYLKRNDKKTFFGHKGYKVGESAFSPDFYKSVTIKLDSKTDLTINGTRLKNNDRKDDALPSLPENIKNEITIKKQTALINDLVSADPEIKAQKNEKELKVSQTSGVFTVDFSGAYPNEKKITDFALNGAKTYAAYMQDDKSFSQLDPYLVKNTEFYKNLKTSLTMFAWKHDSYDFENINLSEFFSYSESLYCVRVSFEQVLKLGNKEYRDNFDKNVFVVKSGEALSIADMQSVEEEIANE